MKRENLELLKPIKINGMTLKNRLANGPYGTVPLADGDGLISDVSVANCRTLVQSGVTADETSRLSVNKNNPVFNLDVFPPYNFSNYNLNPSVPYEDILGGLGLTEGDVTFSAAADKFCCITTAAGGLYVCARQADGSWKIQAVNDTSSARAFMRSEHPAGIPPYFILPME